MRNFILSSAAAAALLVAVPAWAGSRNVDGDCQGGCQQAVGSNNGQAAASSASNSHSRSTARSSATSRASGGRADSSSAGGASTVTITDTVPNRQTIRNTPEVNAPSIVGTNPCTVGISAGVSLPGLGLAGGYGYSDSGCERRATAALAHSTGQAELARELMCDDSAVREARRRIGDLCAADRSATTFQTAVAPAEHPAAIQIAAPAIRVPDYCIVRPHESMADLLMREANCRR
jgi:hypothetical protein